MPATANAPFMGVTSWTIANTSVKQYITIYIYLQLQNKKLQVNAKKESDWYALQEERVKQK